MGVKCGLIDAAGFDYSVGPAELAGSIKSLCAKSAVDFITIKVPYNFIGAVNPLIRFGAALIDTELSFVYSGGQFPDEGRISSARTEFKFCKEFKGGALVPLAKEMRMSRFFRDSKISRKRAVGLWEESIRNHCSGLADQLLIAYCNGRPSGIVTIEFQGSDKISLFLVGVLKKFQRKGIAKNMLKAIVDRYSDSHSIHVDTQADNIAAQRLYQGAGFRLESLKYVLHYWKSH